MSNQNSQVNGQINSQANDSDSSAVTKKVSSITVHIANSKTQNVHVETEEAHKAETIEEQRLRLFSEQSQLIESFKATVFPIELIRNNLKETQRFKVAQSLDKRGIAEMDDLYIAFDHLYLVDDILRQTLSNLNPHSDYGWIINSASRNKLNVVEISNQPNTAEAFKFESVAAYILAHFGKAFYQKDKVYYIGNIAGYLFASYFCAHLKLSYSVTSLNTNIIKGVEYLTPDVVSNTKAVQELSLITKKQLYQLAVFSARVSLHSVDKAIEKMLIADVNDFDKKKEQNVLDGLLRYGGS